MQGLEGGVPEQEWSEGTGVHLHPEMGVGVRAPSRGLKTQDPGLEAFPLWGTDSSPCQG